MMQFKLTDIAAALKGQLKGQDVSFSRISIDTRTLQPGDLFIALQGENFDSHDFVNEAIQKGAAAVIASRPIAAALPCLQVDDTRLALGQLGHFWRKQLSLPVIALTGSCGKTTTKTLLAAILARCGQVLATKGTLNNDIGVPLTLLDLMPEHDYAVIELGANHPGEIAYLTHLLEPQVALITNTAPVHLEGFGNIDGVAKAKGEIFQGLTANGKAILNADDPYFEYWQQSLGKTSFISFGFNPQADIRAHTLVTDKAGSQQFVLITPEGEAAVQLSLLGRHNVLNALAAAAASMTAGANLQQIAAGLQQVEAVDKRLVKRQTKQGALLIDDTYNANFNAFQAALEMLQQFPGEKILIAGDMAELGQWAEHYHRELGTLARKMGVQQLFAYGTLSQFTVDTFGQHAYHFTSHAALAEAVQVILHEQSVVLVKGSRSARMEEVVNRLIA